MSAYNGVVFSAPPPPGVVPDANVKFEAMGLVVCMAIFTPLALITTGIRIFTRTRIVGDLAVDDFLMAGAMACSIALTAYNIDMLRWGLGKDMWNVPIVDLFGIPHFLFINLLAAISFCAATGMAKTSILLFYRRIFPAKLFHAVIWFLVIFTAGYSIASVFVNIFSCKPVRASWDVEFATTGICIDRPIFYFAQAGFGILTDFATVIAPMPMMWKLQLPFKQKLGIAGILTTGGFVCIISIVRLYSLSVLLRSSNLTMDTPPALMWCVIELNMSIVGGCVATVRPFLRKYFPRVLGSSIGPNAMYNYNSNMSGSKPQKRAKSYQLDSAAEAGAFVELAETKKGSASTTVNTTIVNYNSSEEHIIEPETSRNDGIIMKTVQFGTSYEEEGVIHGR